MQIPFTEGRHVRRVHLVGSVPCTDAEAVFEIVSRTIGPYVSRIPDGETGERLQWVKHLEPAFAMEPDLERADAPAVASDPRDAADKIVRFRVRPGCRGADVRFARLQQYSACAKESYAVFKRMRDGGVIAPHTRFQVALAPGWTTLSRFIADECLPELDSPYNAALAREIERISDAIPHTDLALQIDVASAVFGRLQNAWTKAHPTLYGQTRTDMLDRFSEIITGLAMHVPPDADLLLHFCYGDNQHRHSVEPTDMRDMVDLANRLAAAIPRSIQLIHMPVPRDRSDGAYFAPLTGLRLGSDTELCLGLVHYTDGLEGTRRRLATATVYRSNFSVATECGWGRRSPDTIPELLRLHAEAAQL